MSQSWYLRLGPDDKPAPAVALFKRMGIESTGHSLDRRNDKDERPVRIHFQATPAEINTIKQAYPDFEIESANELLN